MKTIERTFDATTGKTTDIERDMTAQEIAELQATQAQAQARAESEAQAEAKRQAAVAKLAALGLEEDDLKALGL